MEQEKDQLQDQQNKPLEQREGLQDSNQNDQEIRNGARNEDQLEQFKQNAPEGGRASYPERQAGAVPSEGDEKPN